MLEVDEDIQIFNLRVSSFKMINADDITGTVNHFRW